MTDAAFSCRCGRVRGTVSGVPRNGFHFACHCGDCRAGARLAGAPDPGTEGVPVYHTTPDRLTITEGRDLLEPLRMRPESHLLRWRATCCGDLVVGTTDRPARPMLSVLARTLGDAPLGPLRARTFLPPARPGGRPRHEGLAAFLPNFLLRPLAARLSGRWRRNPLAQEDAYPAPRDLTPEERARAYGGPAP